MCASPGILVPPPSPLTQTVTHAGEPRVIAVYDVPALVSLAGQAGGVIVMPYAVGDTVVEGEFLLVRPRKPPPPMWKTFLNNHMQELVSLDFFGVDGAIVYRTLVQEARVLGGRIGGMEGH